MEIWTKRATELVVRYAILGESDPSVIDYTPSKTEIPPENKNIMPRAYKSSDGISEGRIASMLDELEKDEGLNIHSVVVARDMKIIASASRPGYSASIPHLSHSLSKVLVSIAVGYLVSDGQLDLNARVVDLLPEYEPREREFRDITVHHLLSMSSGVKFSELGVATEREWTRAFFESKLRFSPGEAFAYNSMNTYILAVIVKRVSGLGVSDIIKKRLLFPLGIEDFFWEIGSEGVEKGGFGVYMSAESWAKIGCLFLARGFYNGVSVIPEKWIDMMLTPALGESSEKNGYEYGYTVWTAPKLGSCLFSGMLGQLVYISFTGNVTVAVCGGNDELFFSDGALGIIEKYLSGTLPDALDDEYRNFERSLSDVEENFLKSSAWVKPLERKKGLLHRLGLRYREPHSPLWNKLIGRFVPTMNNMSILPVFVRTMQSNFPASIEKIGFIREGRRLFLVCRDGGSDFKIEVGLCRFEESIIDVAGEKYRVRALGGIVTENGETSYRIELAYPELPNSMRLTLRLIGKDVIDIKTEEKPGAKIVDTYLTDALSLDARMRFVKDMIEGRLGRGYINKKALGIFERRITAVKEGALNFEELMERERASADTPDQAERSVASLVLRFVGGAERSEGNFLGDLLGMVFGGFRR